MGWPWGPGSKKLGVHNHPFNGTTLNSRIIGLRLLILITTTLNSEYNLGGSMYREKKFNPMLTKKNSCSMLFKITVCVVF